MIMDTANPSADGPVLRGNDYGPLERPGGAWRPRLRVSVVIPAHGHQDKLDVTLASLAAQTYPAELMEVVVVDDGTSPPLRLPEVRPDETRIVAPLPGGWASAHATNSGVAQSEGDVVLRLDSDMLVFGDHVEAQMRWHHAADYLAVLGHKRFVNYQAGDLDPGAVFAAVQAGKAAELYDAETAEPQWIERIIDATAGLRESDHRAFRVLVGATFSVHRRLYEAAGGMDADMVFGSDTVFGYRLHQAGAVFVPDADSSAWHLGPRQISVRGDLAKRYRAPRIANRVPELDLKRPRAARNWDAPLADVTVAAGPGAQSCVDALLTGTTPDVRVTLTGEWPEPETGRHAPLDDPHFEARLLMEAFRGEARVRFASAAVTGREAPYRIEVPAAAVPSPDAVEALVAHANERRLGLVEVMLAEGAVRLERAAAAARAAHLGVAIDAVWGYERIVAGPLVAAFSASPSGAGDPAGSGDWLGGKARGILRRALGR